MSKSELSNKCKQFRSFVRIFFFSCTTPVAVFSRADIFNLKTFAERTKSIIRINLNRNLLARQ